jgi:hypothetical protein
MIIGIYPHKEIKSAKDGVEEKPIHTIQTNISPHALSQKRLENLNKSLILQNRITKRTRVY